ncbi:MAG: hypothetical protein ABIH63_04510 [archaeon]
MELCQENSPNEEEFEEDDELVEFKVMPERSSLLERLTQTPLKVGDLIGENLYRLEKLMENKSGLTTNNNLRFQIEGLAVTLTAYKLKKIQGKRYLQGNRSADYFIEVRYLSNILKGINRTLESKRKTPTGISKILYNVVINLLKNDDTLSDKERQKLDSKRRIYNALTKKFSMRYEDEKFTERVREIGKAIESMKGSNIRRKIEEELSRYKKMPYESLKQVETIEVAKAMAHEEEALRHMIAKT